MGFFGVENTIMELSKELSRISPYLPIIGVFKNAQNPHIELAELARLHNLDAKVFECRGPLDLKAAFSIREFIKRNGVKIVHSHGCKANFYALLSTRFINNNLALSATCYPWNDITYSFKGKLYSYLDKSWLNRFDRIITDSDETRLEILRRGLPRTKVLTIDNGIDVSRFENIIDTSEVQKTFGIKTQQEIIGTIGRLSEEKGHFLFIEMARELLEDFPNLSFLIVGDGPLKEKLQKKVSELGLQEHILFTGIRSDIPEILSVIDIFVLPSLSEGLPMVLLEAMAAKKPVVATNVGAVPRVITHNETGIIVRPDVRDLKDGVIVLLKDKTKAKRLGWKAYCKIKEQFSSTRMAQKYIEVYEQVLVTKLF